MSAHVHFFHMLIDIRMFSIARLQKLFNHEKFLNYRMLTLPSSYLHNFNPE